MRIKSTGIGQLIWLVPLDAAFEVFARCKNCGSESRIEVEVSCSKRERKWNGITEQLTDEAVSFVAVSVGYLDTLHAHSLICFIKLRIIYFLEGLFNTCLSGQQPAKKLKSSTNICQIASYSTEPQRGPASVKSLA